MNTTECIQIIEVRYNAVYEGLTAFGGEHLFRIQHVPERLLKLKPAELKAQAEHIKANLK